MGSAARAPFCFGLFLVMGFCFQGNRLYADLVLLVDFNTSSSNSRTASVSDFARLGVSNLLGSENVLSVDGTDRSMFSSANFVSNSSGEATFGNELNEGTLLSSWSGGNLSPFRAYSLTSTLESNWQSQSSSSENDSSALLVDYLHLTRNDQYSGPVALKLQNLGLEANKEYKLYLIGHLGLGRSKGDAYWTESVFQGVNSNSIKFDSSKSSSGFYQETFRTTSSFNSTDQLELLWSINDGASFATFNGFAITEVPAIPEPNSSFVISLLILTNLAFYRKRNITSVLKD